jgi:hypothetical protein
MNALWDLLFGSTPHDHGKGCCCATCYGIAAQELNAEVYYNNARKATTYVPEKEVKGERVINPIDEYKIGDVVTLEPPPKYEKTLGDAAKEVNGEISDNQIKLLENK